MAKTSKEKNKSLSPNSKRVRAGSSAKSKLQSNVPSIRKSKRNRKSVDISDNYVDMSFSESEAQPLHQYPNPPELTCALMTEHLTKAPPADSPMLSNTDNESGMISLQKPSLASRKL